MTTTQPRLPWVTIVTPSMNQGSFIREAIESVLSQTYPNIEYIIMDAGSTDETHAVAAEYEGRLCYISEPDRGQSHAINKGWRMAKGEILAWLCADDILLPGAVQAIVDEFARQPSAAFVFGGCEIIDREGHSLCVQLACQPDTRKLIRRSYVAQPAAFFAREAIEAVGFVDESLHFGMDWDLFIRLSLFGPVVSIEPVLAKARMYAETKSASGGFQRWRELVKIMRRYDEERYPPAYFLYGAAILHETVRRRMERLPRWLSGARSIVWPRFEYLFERVWITALTRVHRGWWPDAWAATMMTCDIPAGGGVLRVRGRLPTEYPQLIGQQLTVTCEGELLARRELASGSFSWDLPLPERSHLRKVEVKICASRSFVPKRCGLNQDTRHLAYLLDELVRL